MNTPKKLLTFAQNPELALLNELQEANENLKILAEKTRKVSIVGAEVVTIKGDSPSDEHIVELIKPLIPAPIKGDAGGDYILTEEDKKEISSKIEVPVVEKIVETIIEKQPIVTNEIKEVAVAETAEEIRNKLELLEKDERLKIEAIKDLREELDKLKNQIKQLPTYVGGSGGKGHIKPYDLSSQLNGVLKTFNLPANWTIISVHTGGSTPTTFRPITDYTFTPTSITFTSEINEATTLASGQTIIVVYEEA